MVEEISSDILGKLNLTPSNDFEDFVGIKDRIAEMSLLLHLESEEVKMVGIWGTSGIGKTTIARALFSYLLGQFQSSVYIDKAFITKSMEGYGRKDLSDYNVKLNLRKRFLSEILHRKNINMNAMERLKHQKVLIVIDDLDDQDVLDALAGKPEWFGNGSRVIVVTNNRHFLNAHEIGYIYEVSLPSDKLALEMFSRSAFRKNSPPDGFMELSSKVVSLVGKLPLGINVLGSSLRSKGKECWTKMMPRLQNDLNGKIEKTLRISYDGLDNEKDKAIFRHIACLFNHMEVKDIKLFLADSDLDIDIGLKNLIDTSLIHVRFNMVDMHCLLLDMGKEICRQSSDEPGEREFLVNSNDICDVLQDNTGTKNVLGISLDTSEIDELHVNENAFKGMRNLRFLEIHSKKDVPRKFGRLELPESFDYFPTKLKLLSWHEYPMRSMPSNFRPESLVKLDMKNSKLKKLWDGVVSLTCLKEINLWGSDNLEDIPDLSKAASLEVLRLGHCESLVEFPHSTRNLTDHNNEKLKEGLQYLSCLKEMDLRGCHRLKAIPNLSMATYLEILFLDDCSSLVELPSSIRNLNKLGWLSITNCTKLETLPVDINLKYLDILDLSGCARLTEFPDISTNISTLNLSKTSVKEVPRWVNKFSRLQQLHMGSCNKLGIVHLNISKLRHLNLADFTDCGSLAKVDISGYPTEVASCSLSDNYVPKAVLRFNNCFNLNQDALLWNHSIIFPSLMLPGEKVPSYFTHRTTGTSLANIPLHRSSLEQKVFRFRACAAVTFNPLSNPFLAGANIPVNCQLKGVVVGNVIDQVCSFWTTLQGSQLLTMECCIPLNEDNTPVEQPKNIHVDMQVRVVGYDASYFKLNGWGLRVLEDWSPSENQPHIPNTLIHVCEDDMVYETKHGEECLEQEGCNKRMRII